MRTALPSLRGMLPYLRVARRVGVVGAALLVAFHGRLLATQLLNGELADPGLAFRWLLAGVLVATLVGLRRSGASLFSRQGVAVWVLAALLHGPVIAAEAGNDAGMLALPEAVATAVVQIAATSGSLAVGLWILNLLIATINRVSALRSAAIVGLTSPFPDPNRRPFSPRPPPRF